jgi:hypothetical protein
MVQQMFWPSQIVQQMLSPTLQLQATPQMQLQATPQM